MRVHPMKVLGGVLALGWAVYLLAHTFVTVDFRVPIPPMFAVALLLVWPKPEGFRVASLFAVPRWSYPLLLVFGLMGIGEPAENALYALVLLTTIAVFRFFARDAKSYATVCACFYGVLALSSAVLFLSRVAPEIGLVLRYTLFGESALERPFPTGLSPLTHIYGYQVAATGAIGLTLIVHALRPVSFRPAVAALLFIHVAATLLLGMQRSALFGTALAGAILVVRHRGDRLLRIIAALGLGVVLLVASGVDTSWLDSTVIGKDRTDTSKTMRMQLQVETVEVILRHPWGLVFEGSDWDPEIFEWGGVLSSTGLSGHNAYLMLVAFLGVPSIALVVWILGKVIRAGVIHALGDLDGPAGPWPCAMFLALIATLVNALLHNTSLFNADGSTLITYVAVWHWHDLMRSEGTTS